MARAAAAVSVQPGRRGRRGQRVQRGQQGRRGRRASRETPVIPEQLDRKGRRGQRGRACQRVALPARPSLNCPAQIMTRHGLPRRVVAICPKASMTRTMTASWMPPKLYPGRVSQVNQAPLHPHRTVMRLPMSQASKRHSTERYRHQNWGQMSLPSLPEKCRQINCQAMSMM